MVFCENWSLASIVVNYQIHGSLMIHSELAQQYHPIAIQ